MFGLRVLKRDFVINLSALSWVTTPRRSVGGAPALSSLRCRADLRSTEAAVQAGLLCGITTICQINLGEFLCDASGPAVFPDR